MKKLIVLLIVMILACSSSLVSADKDEQHLQECLVYLKMLNGYRIATEHAIEYTIKICKEKEVPKETCFGAMSISEKLSSTFESLNKDAKEYCGEEIEKYKKTLKK